MAINKDIGEVITVTEATNFTHSFQEENPNAIISFFVGTNKLNLILNQEDCRGIRIYNGHDWNEDKANLVLVGVNKDGEDMTDGVIIEHLNPCPPDCPQNSPLIVEP